MMLSPSLLSQHGKRVRTVILLSEDPSECNGVLDARFPSIAFECEERLHAPFGDGGKLEEIASDNELHGIVTTIDRR
jgi:hypothetical protein